MDSVEPYRIKRISEDVIFRVNFENELLTGESLSGTPTITAETGSGLTIGTPSIVGDEVLAMFEDGVARTRPWCITVTVTVDSTNPDQIFVKEVGLQVLEDC